MHFRTILYALLLALPVAAYAQSQTVTGTVTNKTIDKPAAGDDVVLLKLAQGMQELTRTKTNARGKYTLTIPAGEDSGAMHLVRVTHDRANYFAPVPPGTSTADVEVYTAAPELAGVAVSEDVLQIQTAPDGASLRVVEHFVVHNDSQPAKTLFSDHPFELYLPAGATVEGGSAKAPGGFAVEQAVVPMNDPGHFTILYPIRPGDTEFAVFFRIPYTGSFDFKPRLTLPTETIGIVLPTTMKFNPASGTPYTPVPPDELGGKELAFVANHVNPSQPLGFTVTGKGELPHNTPVQNGADASQPNAGAQSGAAVDSRPGGGLGTPLDKDADRDPWTKYRWWILSGLAVILAIAAGVMMRAPAGQSSAQTLAATTPAGALQVLRDEMFAVETDRLEGRLSEPEYAELKSAYDLVLRRALQRSGARTTDPNKVEIVPE